MIPESQIKNLAEQALDGTANFLVDVQVNVGNRILIQIDNPQGLTVDDCVKVSRYVESNLDREKEDFELEVSSPGADKPFKVFEQYKKYTGRKVEVKTTDGRKLTGMLETASPEKIKLKLVSEGKAKLKKNEPSEIELDMNDIKQTRAIISFK